MPQQSQTTPRSVGRNETFNQIVLMLILAFAFRVFVVEAFVIPTGSMATTLMGAHARFVCENCGYHYDVNYSSGSRSAPTEIDIPRTDRRRGEDWRVFCPNCGFQAGTEQTRGPRIFYGDRILVLKYAYLLQKPQRWDVIVFKTPSDPSIYHYSQAYIKRLIGTPGESIMILDGDIYVATKPDATDGDWAIQRKPDVVQDALWRVVNDSDFAPQGLTPEARQAYETRTLESYLPWRSADGKWQYARDNTGARSYDFGDRYGTGTLRFDPLISTDKCALTDWLAYDQVQGQGRLNPVSDLKLSLSYTRLGGRGPLELRLSKREDIFIARLLPDSVELLRADVADPENASVIASRPWGFGNRSARVEFMNVDYRVRLIIDGQEALATTPAQYAPDVAWLRSEETAPSYPQVSITAAQQVCGLTHLSLWRDIFYTTVQAQGGASVSRAGPDNPVHLGKEEYFALGDNSPLSQDGRYWRDPVELPSEQVDAQAGVVPERFLLGKALLVYWPAGYRLYYDNFPDLIPNFGEMRFIH